MAAAKGGSRRRGSKPECQSPTRKAVVASRYAARSSPPTVSGSHPRSVPAPPRVEYALTGLGRSLLEPIGALGHWSAQYGDAFVAAQGRHD
ncbi:winged helix-turn-helix transcriptional regulator [Streptomyces sp. NPDC048462]|uniref:winged helix-turn-helix transcriptional regulator n=1 Tax=Streptomyces sp. NPDC048462 TaxID=3365555 RepID=UPI00371D971E